MTLTLSNLGEYLTNYYKENPIEESASQCRYTLQSKVVELFEDTHYCIHTHQPSYYSNNEFQIGFGSYYSPQGFAHVKFTKKVVKRASGRYHNWVEYTITKVEVSIFGWFEYLANVPLKQVRSMISLAQKNLENKYFNEALEEVRKALNGDVEALLMVAKNGTSTNYIQAIDFVREEQKNEGNL